MTTRSFCAYASLLLMYGVISAAALPRQQHTVLVGTVGNDTVAVDRFVRDATNLDGVLFVRRPQPHTMHYKATIAPEGRFTQLEIVWRDAKGVEMRAADMSFGIDSIRSELRASAPQNFGAPAKLDALPIPPEPYAAHSYGMLEYAAMVLLNGENPGKSLEWIIVGATKTEKRPVLRVVRDTIELEFVAGPVFAQMDTNKRVVLMSIGSPPSQIIVRRSEKDIDIAKLTASFAARDSVVGGLVGGNRKRN